ncbi:hypothetical protein NKH18_28590 [Streptomyces sp. M10(2022)]
MGEHDHAQLVRWCGEFVDTTGELPAVDAASWARSRFADRHFTFWETRTAPRIHGGRDVDGRRHGPVDPVYTRPTSVAMATRAP